MKRRWPYPREDGLDALLDVGIAEAGTPRLTWRGEPELSDWELVCGRKSYNVHTAIIGVGERRSDVLSAQIKQIGQVGVQRRTNLSAGGADALVPQPCWSIFEQVLDFFYGGDFKVTLETAMPAYKVAHALAMPALAKVVVTFLKAQLTKASAPKLLASALQFGPAAKPVVKQCEQLVAQNLDGYNAMELINALMERGAEAMVATLHAVLSHPQKKASDARVSNLVASALRTCGWSQPVSTTALKDDLREAFQRLFPYVTTVEMGDVLPIISMVVAVPNVLLSGGKTPPPGLKLEGGSLPGNAAGYLGTYHLVVGKPVNGRPAYQRASDATDDDDDDDDEEDDDDDDDDDDEPPPAKGKGKGGAAKPSGSAAAAPGGRWIAFAGDRWMGQTEDVLGKRKGSLDLPDAAAASPDVSTKTWKANAGGAGAAWVEAPQLKCTAWTPPPAGLKVKLENGPQVTRMHVGDAIALLSHAVHNDPPSEAVQKLCTPFIASQFHELQSAGQAQLHLLPPKIVVDLLDMNCLNVKSEDQVFRMIRAYIGARKDVVDWQAQLWSTCRFCSITPATLEVALTIAEIPPQSIQLGMLARIYHTEYDKYRTDYDSFIAKHSPAGQNAGDRSARGDRLRARRAQ